MHSAICWLLILGGCGDNIRPNHSDGGDNDGMCDPSACPHDACHNAVCIANTCQLVDISACGTPSCRLDGCGADTDGDGLSDAWETNRYIDVNCNGVNDAGDIDLPGADPAKPDIYVNYDYMAATDHDHAPPAASLDQVVHAFAAHGIALHVLAPNAPIAEHVVTTLDLAATSACAGDDFVTLASLRKPNLGLAYHYMVFAHRATTPDLTHQPACPTDCGRFPDPDSTGSADLPGGGVVIAFGAFTDGHRQIGIETLASTIMHELGHNLGLKHGGADECVGNDKPNYMSVMNYAYQQNGIVVADAPGSTSFRTCAVEADCEPPTISSGACAMANACHCTDDLTGVVGFEVCYRVDYSALALPTLNELAPSPGVGGLDENFGVSGPATDEDVVLYFVPGPAQLVGASNGSPIDWNNDGSIGAHVTADINNDGTNSLLTTQNDWETSAGRFTHLHLAFQCP